MKVIVTSSFDKGYLKFVSKYFDKKKLAENLKAKEYNFIPLHFPYFKFKAKLNLVDFRGVLLIIENNTIIPLILFLKKDKKYGENINWRDYEQMILDEYDMAIDDIEK